MLKNDLAAVSRLFPLDLQEVRKHLELLIGELNIPRSKLVLGGFSQGAVLAIDTAFHHHDPCAALIILSGTLANADQWARLAPLHAKTIFFQSHGTEDPILPFQLAISLEALLHASHLKGKLHPFHGGHDVPHSILVQLNHFLTNTLATS